MSRFFPHTPYAEDQPLPKTILTTHVLHRGLTTGTTLGLLTYPLRRFLPLSFRLTSPTTLLLHTGTAALAATAAMAVYLPYHMRDAGEIGWQDRSWRLMENKGQLETDDWSAGGAVLGALVAGWRRGAVKEVVRVVAGAAGIGSLAGVGVYMTWRYGIMRGERPEEVSTTTTAT